jgi:hypothetical protein
MFGYRPYGLGPICGLFSSSHTDSSGLADVWLPALRTWVRFAVYFRVPTQTLPGRLMFGYRPYGSGSDLRSIFEFPHRLFRAGLMFGYRPYGPGSDLRFIAGYHTPSSGLG